ncbi:MAG: hypothetical protein U0930_13495 [Pirellulales bacterium]
MSLNQFGLTLLLLALLGQSTYADLNVYKMYSIEFLVDTCDAVCVARLDREDSQDHPQIVRMIKGDSSNIRLPLTPVGPDPTFLGGACQSKLRLFFVRKKSELVHSIDLARRKDINSSPSIYSTLYGVTQYGELLLTESSLFKCIEDRLGAEKTKPIPNRRTYQMKFAVPGETVNLGETAENFPLANDSEMYTLVVPSDTARRDYFLELLKKGDAVEKIFAIGELSSLRDAESEAAVRAAVQIQNVRTIYRYEAGKEVCEWNVQTVRDVAKRAVQFLDANP